MHKHGEGFNTPVLALDDQAREDHRHTRHARWGCRWHMSISYVENMLSTADQRPERRIDRRGCHITYLAALSYGVCKSIDPSGRTVAVVSRLRASRPWPSSVKQNWPLYIRRGHKKVSGIEPMINNCRLQDLECQQSVENCLDIWTPSCVASEGANGEIVMDANERASGTVHGHNGIRM